MFVNSDSAIIEHQIDVKLLPPINEKGKYFFIPVFVIFLLGSMSVKFSETPCNHYRYYVMGYYIL